MRVMVIGKGGREHAIVKVLLESSVTSQVFALPGNQGMFPEATLVDSDMGLESVYRAYIENKIDLLIVGPEDPLVAGLADFMRERGATVFGPDQQGARLEGSKIFSKRFMAKYNIPTAYFEVVESAEDVAKQAENFTPPYVLKADGLAAGKGVFICKDKPELSLAAQKVFVKKILGDAGKYAILEQFQPGYELSFFILTNGKNYISLPMAQDHKRLLDNDEGPNTGGMGTVAPMSVSSSLYESITKKIVEPTVRGIATEGFNYRGVVFIGIMVTTDGPQVLEYNVRFGDPEPQVLLPLLDGDWGEVFKKIANGEVPKTQWSNQFASCVVLAAENYPGNPKKGVSIEGDFKAMANQYFLHAGTKKRDGVWLTDGGRVLNAIGVGDSMAEATENAYKQANKVGWPGMQKRTDIGSKALKL